MAGKANAESPTPFFVAVHVGAGYHSPSNEKALRSAMNRACLAAASLLSKGSGRCIDAVAAAIQVLEDDPCTNAGRGSNLTEDGNVECDASIMDAKSGAFGAVGAVPDQVFEMLSKLLLYWPKSKLLEFLYWVEFLQSSCQVKGHLSGLSQRAFPCQKVLERPVRSYLSILAHLR